MGGSKNRTQSKCRMWEKERRNRLCAGFVGLAEVLPSSPPNATKILILQHAVKYIKELQKRNEELEESEKKRSDNVSALQDKLTVLEERCTQLIQHMQKNGLSINSTLLLNSKDDHISTDIVCNTKNSTDKNTKQLSLNSEISDKKDQDVNKTEQLNENSNEKSNDNTNDNLLKAEKAVMRKVHISKKKKLKRKLSKNVSSETNIMNITSNLMAKNNMINNVWLASGNQNNAMMIGNTIVPLLPKTSPLLLTSAPQTPAIFLLQKPFITNYTGITKNTDGNLPIIKHILPINSNEKHKTYANFDITRTTMVNKVPISAFSGVCSVNTKKISAKPRSSFRVSHGIRRKFLNTFKKKKSDEKLVKSENDKENLSNDNTTTSDKPESTTVINNDAKASQEKVNTDHVDSLVTNEKNKLDNTLINIQSDNNSLDPKIVLNETRKSSEKSLFTNKDASNKDVNNAVNIEKQNIDKIKSVENTKKSSANSKGTHESTVIIEKSLSVVVSKSEMLKSNSSLIECKSNVSNTIRSQDSNCRLQSGKVISSANGIIHNSEIPEDLLATFVTPSEQTMPPSPLVSSPLAASPTAAFLSAFPLVCSGPRPDTPLTDNLQTPNLCSLDHFAFFSSKEASNMSLGNTHNLFSECSSKPLFNAQTGKPKSVWPQTQNFSKPPDVPSNPKYIKNENCSRNLSSDKEPIGKNVVSTSSTCIYSGSQGIFQSSKTANPESQYSIGENIFNYENLSIANQKDGSNIKDTLPPKQYNFSTSQNLSKNKSNGNNVVCTSNSLNYSENVISSASCGNARSYNYNIMSLNSNDSEACKRNQSSENCMKLILPEYPTTSKNIDIPFSFQSQSKHTFPNSSNIYTTCNTYNPFSSDFSSNSMNLGLTCGNSLNNMRTKTSTTYFSDFNSSNIYSQNYNNWNDDNQLEYETNKNEYNKKLNLPISFNQNQSHNVVPDFQSDIRFSLPVMSKSTSNNRQTLNIDKSSTKVKCSIKDPKYQTDSNVKNNKSDFNIQKGPVNWMTSDVNSNNEVYSPNFKEIKSEQNFVLSNTSQTCLDIGTNAPGIAPNLNCKKTELFEQPLFPLPPSSYVSQVVNEDNQFTWSPSKLTSFVDNSTVVPCSLPTLVGDLALGIISESKMTYPSFIQDQDNTIKDRKNITSKNKEEFLNKNCNQNIEGNSSQGTGNFFSVSQLVEREKIVNNVDNQSKVCVSEIHKGEIGGVNQDKNFNSQLRGVNKPYESMQSCGNSAVFSNDNYSTEISTNNTHGLQKNNNFNKADGNIKIINKNNYSTEALLQNNTQYQNSKKIKQSIEKLYTDSSNYPIHSNQFISSSHPLQFDNFPQNQQYSTTTFPYNGSSVGMNSNFYTSSNFISTNNVGTSNYINSTFSTDINEFQNNAENVFSFKIDNCKTKSQNDAPPDFTKYSSNSKVSMISKENTKNKSELCVKKDMTPPNKRQKKLKNGYHGAYGDKCFNTLSNQVNSPMVMDESFFAYSSSQMHPYPTQGNLLSSTVHSQKVNFVPKTTMNANMSSSPNPAGTSLTNFNLSTIFPEINKRSSMSTFNDGPHLNPHLTKGANLGLFH